MSNQDRNYLTRSESKRRENRSVKRKKLDRLLNVLIAVVAVLIVINLYFIFSNKEDVAQNQAETTSESNQSPNPPQSSQPAVSTGEDEQKEPQQEEPNTNDIEQSGDFNGEQNGQSQSTNEESNVITGNNSSTTTVNSSSDPLVLEEIIDPNWQVTPTSQTGEHVSAYETGHIDYEEKLVTIRNAVNLTEGNVIYWSVKNNGSSDSAISVISSKDQAEKYRVTIQWIANQGWKPVKVEKLKQIDGTY
ncbi:hypothetical protein CD30_10235 [Ureibacillus massiliensis 4400831 = CIP 108448 = CCUG 49529]|uniref:DUF1510 domain-containing protein n=1 Tax=Ureibacillus massiliensis 4400831 = CIP 108448 = CCUG 49529 TaxID=1211035 RepID=A0A0A3J152_9BACL|nr:YrrS family protein [Ureibacillus massiliensis]KGR90729.1 hypothetical protein CD30_10235 [Ureibacillus massiliensis 4400831 = CIP 108448 = CCUG 49529]